MQCSRRFRAIWLYFPLVLSVLMLSWAACSAPVSSGVTSATQINNTSTVVPTFETTVFKPFPNASQLNAYLTQLANSGLLSGSVLMARNAMMFSKGYGLADKDAHIFNTPHTRFRIGSITKQFTAMAILILQQRGKLHVQDSLCRYISDCPQDWQPVTIEHLLTHTSGIPDYITFPDFVPTWTQSTTPEQLIARFKTMPLEFSPGSLFRYSNSGYILLGYIIERVTGEAYATFLQKNIFGPLKMNDTGYDSQYPALPQHATGYYKGYVKPDAYDPSVLYAAGALYSTVEDLYVWDQALMMHTLIPQQAQADMLQLHIPCPPSGARGCLLSTDQGYGYGLFLAQEPQGKLIYHVGRIDGYLTYNGFYPTSNLVVVVLSNLETTDVLKIGRILAAMV